MCIILQPGSQEGVSAFISAQQLQSDEKSISEMTTLTNLGP